MTIPSASAAILASIERAFGFVPPFFEPAVETPDVLDNLWHQTQTAYVDNPLPALFKEMLSAYLSRYCSVSYCLVCHSCTLRPLGMSGPDVLRLLQTPVLTDAEARASILALNGAANAHALPSPGSWQEAAVMGLSSAIYLCQPAASAARACLLNVLGPANYNRVIALISYVKTCHAWVESHPEVSYLVDSRYQQHFGTLADEEPGLHRYFQEYLTSYREAQHGATLNETHLTVATRGDEAERTIEILEQRLRSVLDERRQAAEFAQELVAVVSHDLRNPLTAIALSARIILGSRPTDERASRAVHRILSSAQRATRLVGSLLDFTQARVGGGIAVRLASANIHELTAHSVEEMQAANPERTIALVQHGDGAGRWDADRIYQALGNIIGNAVSHSPKDSIVEVKAHSDELNVYVVVHNLNREGPIAPELLPILFEPFKQERRHVSENKSIGLGLYIVRSIARAHSGEVAVISTERGTTFEMRLPRSLGPSMSPGTGPDP